MKDHLFIMDALTDVDEDLIAQAEAICPKRPWKAWIAAAAVLAVVCSVSTILAYLAQDPLSPSQPFQTIFKPQNIIRDPSIPTPPLPSISTPTGVPDDSEASPPTQPVSPPEDPSYPDIPAPTQPSTPPEDPRDPVPPTPIPPSPDVTKIISLSAPDFMQGLVGSASTGISTGSDAEARLRFVSLTARAVEILPDTYHMIGQSTIKFRLIQMETIRTIRGQCSVNSFYYILPEAYVTDLTKYDALVIPIVRQFGHINHVLYNDTTQELQAMDLVVLGYYPYLIGEITAFSDGYIDTSLWTSTENWTKKFGNRYVPPEYSSLEAYEQRILEQHSTGYSDDVIIAAISPENDQVSSAQEYVKPFANGIFIPQELQNTNNWTYYRRYINGYPTTERVYIDSRNAHYSRQFTDADIQNLPDLATELKRINDIYNAGQLTPPHLKSWEKMRFTQYSIFGWYAKTENSTYAVIHVSWTYSDDTEKHWDDRLHYDDQYYIIESGCTDWQGIEYEDLTALLGPYPDFVVQVDGYDDGGRVTTPIYEMPYA
jgi:hypothetical protein